MDSGKNLTVEQAASSQTSTSKLSRSMQINPAKFYSNPVKVKTEPSTPDKRMSLWPTMSQQRRPSLHSSQEYSEIKSEAREGSHELQDDGKVSPILISDANDEDEEDEDEPQIEKPQARHNAPTHLVVPTRQYDTSSEAEQEVIERRSSRSSSDSAEVEVDDEEDEEEDWNWIGGVIHPPRAHRAQVGTYQGIKFRDRVYSEGDIVSYSVSSGENYVAIIKSLFAISDTPMAKVKLLLKAQQRLDQKIATMNKRGKQIVSNEEDWRLICAGHDELFLDPRGVRNISVRRLAAHVRVMTFEHYCRFMARKAKMTLLAKNNPEQHDVVYFSRQLTCQDEPPTPSAIVVKRKREYELKKQFKTVNNDEDFRSSRHRFESKSRNSSPQPTPKQVSRTTTGTFTTSTTATPVTATATRTITSISQLTQSSTLKSNNALKEFGESGLHLAAREGKQELIEALIKRGMNINQRDTNDCTAIMIATIYNHPQAAETLLRCGANVNIRGGGHAGATALHFACDMDFPDMVSVLLQGGADPTIKDDHGDTPMDRTSHSAILQLLRNAQSQRSNT